MGRIVRIREFLSKYGSYYTVWYADGSKRNYWDETPEIVSFIEYAHEKGIVRENAQCKEYSADPKFETL